MVYYITSSLGETARILVRNGDIYEGVLKAVSSKFDCTLGEAHLVQHKKNNGLIIEDEGIVPSKERLINNLLIACKDIVSVNITKTEEPEIDNFTDEAITANQKHTNGQIIERELQKWVPQDGDIDMRGGLEDNTKVNGWSADEMFRTNQEKFGVTSTYSDDLLQYTTPLPKDSTREMELKAEQTAREIEQSKGHIRRQEIDSGRSEEEAFAAVVRPQTTSTASKTSQASTGHSCMNGKSQRGATEAVPPTVLPLDERKVPCTNTQTALPNVKAVSVAPVHSIPNSVDNVDNMPPDQVSKASPAVEAGPAEMHSSASSKSDHDDVVKGLKEFHSNFTLSEKPAKKAKDVLPQSADRIDATATKTAATPIPETIPAATDVTKTDEKKSVKTVEPADSILTKSKLNPLAKEFKFTPKTQKPASSPQPPYVNVVAAQPFSPTSIRAPLGASPFPHPQSVMVVPQQFNMYRGKQPFNKPARGQSYGGREQGESPPFISAAAATGSPIIAPGVGTFSPQQVYQIPSHQPVAYVQSPAAMVPSPQMMQQYVVPPGPTRFIAPVSSPAASAVPMSQAYQDGSPMPVYVTGNMAAMQGAGTLQGQPQPSPSQQGQFIFTPVPQMPPGQPQATGPHQGQVTPGQFGQSPLVYLPQVTPNASVPTSASSSVSYMPGPFHGERMQ